MPEPARLFLRQHDHLDGFLREALSSQHVNHSSVPFARRPFARVALARRAVRTNPFSHIHSRASSRASPSHAPQTSLRRPIACRARRATSLGSRARARAPRRSSRARHRASPRSSTRRARARNPRSRAPRTTWSSRARGASSTTTMRARARAPPRARRRRARTCCG